jgi:hypothetical protein
MAGPERLQSGDKLIVEGTDKVTAGSEAKAVEVQNNGAKPDVLRFFVRRPVFAWVIAILIMMAGVLAIRTLPIAQYQDVAPPR